MLTTIIRIGSILSWGSVFFIPRNSVKRYIPVTISAALVVVTAAFIGSNYGFWEIKGSSKKRMWNLLSLGLGYFTIANLWIFHLTFGKFRLYFLINLINNLVYAFGIIPILEKMNFLNYAKFRRTYHIIVTMTHSLFLYGYQLFFDKQDSRNLQWFNK